MAAVYGSSTYFWNATDSEDAIILQQILKGYFSNLTLTTGIAILILGPLIMFGNGIVIAAIWKDPFKQLRASPSNIIIASMAVCDFLVGVSAIILQGTWFISMSMNTELLKHLAPFAYKVGDVLLGASVFHILALTIDRVIAVVDPLLYKPRVTRKRVLFAVILLWVFVFTIFIAQLLKSQKYYVRNLISITYVGIIEFLVTCLCYVIIYKVRKQTKEIKKSREPCMIGYRKVAERDRKTTKSIMLILAFFLLCCTIFLVSFIILLTCSSCRSHLDVIITVFFSSSILIHVNSAINPILYAFRLPKFRKPVVYILRVRRQTLVDVETSHKTPQLDEEKDATHPIYRRKNLPI